MPRAKKPVRNQRRDPYERALETAKKRLAHAIDEQAKCRNKLAGLNDEIPRLQRIISVFEPPKNPVQFMVSAPQRPKPQFAHISEIGSIDPKDLKSLAPPEDLTGMGSLINGEKIQGEDLLPDPSGKEVLD